MFTVLGIEIQMFMARGLEIQKFRARYNGIAGSHCLNTWGVALSATTQEHNHKLPKQFGNITKWLWKFMFVLGPWALGPGAPII